LQRSVDGRDNWQEIDKVPAAGYSSDEQQYDALDEQPLRQAYYRLMTLDFSGAISYSDLVLLERTSIKNTGLQVFPNPTRSSITIQYEAVKSQDYSVALFDIIGNQIWTQEGQHVEGINEVVYPMDHLPNGTYFLRMTNSDEQLTEMVILEK